MRKPLSRRTVLRGTGVAMALPWLEAMLPKSSRAQAAGSSALRFVSWYWPNGYYRPTAYQGGFADDWTPAVTGTGFSMSPILQSLAPYKSEIQVVSGVANPPAEKSTISELHFCNTGSFLTCRAMTSNNQNSGISVDQVAASQLKAYTRFPSVEIGTNSNPGGFPLTSAISWNSATSPRSPESRATALFDRLFKDVTGGTTTTTPDPAEVKKNLYRKSVLDSVLVSAKSLKGRLGAADKLRLDEYLTGVNELEARLKPPPPLTSGCPVPVRPTDSDDIRTQTKNLIDVMVMAMQCDLSRVFTFMFERGGTDDLSYSFLKYAGKPINDGHHLLSHHHANVANLGKLKEILSWQVEQFAYFLGKLANINEGTESLLHKSCIFFSSECGDGDAHEALRLPIVVAGSAGGFLKGGKHVSFANDPSKADLFLTLLQAVGVNVATFGADGDQALNGLT